MSNYLVHYPQQSALICAVWLCCAPDGQATPRWETVTQPAVGAPESFGAYNAGCVRGATPLAPVGEGYQVMRLSRRRYYGHPTLIAFIQRMGQLTAATGYRLLIGDLGQPRGGPTLTGHRSHQSGLDVDIWLLHQPRAVLLPEKDVEGLSAISMVNALAGHVDKVHWSALQRDLLQRAASAPEVERLFVHPVIKQALCDSEPAHNRRWLVKVRPWWGHDAHVHVRLACPQGSPLCQPQKPLPLGDGCDGALLQWITEIRDALLSLKPPKKADPPVVEKQPDACTGVLWGP